MNSTRIGVSVILSIVFVAALSFVSEAQAAPFTEASMRLDRMKVSITDNDILIVAKPASTATEDHLDIVFSAGFGVDSTASNITVTTTGIPSTYQGESLTAWPGIGSAASGVSGQVVTVDSDDVTAGTLYGFLITAGIDNPGSPGSDLVQVIRTETSGDAEIDSTSVAVAIISEDQITINAVVPPTFSFSLSATSDDFASNLSSSAVVSTAGIDVTIGTNAANGWIAWLKSANAGLDSATTSDSIDTSGSVNDACTTISTGADFYQLSVEIDTDSGTGTGTVAVDDEYDCDHDGDPWTGGTFSATYEEIGTADGTTDGDVITLYALAAISAVKPAATDYTDTWTVIGAGNF